MLVHYVPFVVEVILLLFPANTTAFHEYNTIQKHLHIAHQAGGRSRFDNATKKAHIEFKRHILSYRHLFSNSNNFYVLRLISQVYNLFVKSVPYIIYRQRWVWSGSANNETIENIVY